MIKTIAILLAMIIATQNIYTSSHWDKIGIDVRDGQFQEKDDYKLTVITSCSQVDLSIPPFNHTDVVYSGYLNVKKGGSAIAFIFYGKEGVPKEDVKNHPTIIWLNGGPGSSSQLGNFMELGPHFVRPTNMAPYEIVKNNYTWIKSFNVLFVDQPVGTGLSYADPDFKPSPYSKSMGEVATDFYAALEELYFNSNGCFNQLGITGDKPLYVFGESYGGKYAPAIGLKIKH